MLILGGIILDNLNSQIVKADTHIHSEFSHDSQSKISAICRSAVEKGIDIICITDHCDIEYCDKLDLQGIIGASVRSAKEEGEKFSNLPEVLAGVELGEYIHNPQEAERIIGINRFDSVIGSVHAVSFEGFTQPYSQIDFSKMTSVTLMKYTDKYFDELLESAKTTDYDILAHITCPFRYINGKYSLNLDTMLFKDKTDEILKTLIKRNKALEINSSGIGNKTYNEFLPDKQIVKRYKELGGKLITLGSDAHTPERIANGFTELYIMLDELGFEYAYYFKNRKPIRYTLKQ